MLEDMEVDRVYSETIAALGWARSWVGPLAPTCSPRPVLTGTWGWAEVVCAHEERIASARPRRTVLLCDGGPLRRGVVFRSPGRLQASTKDARPIAMLSARSLGSSRISATEHTDQNARRDDRRLAFAARVGES